MKKAILILIVFLAFAIGVSGQSLDMSGPIDLVVLLDTSASMSNSYRENSDYLIGPFLREFLHIGDTFHLISFSGSPKLEISRKVEGSGDVETIIGRMLLMHPLDPQTDLAGALSFAEKFASSLSGGRTKKIVVLSDGDAPNTQSLINDSSGRLKNQRTDLQYISLPVKGNGPSSGRPAGQAPQTAAQPSGSPPTQSGTQTAPAQSAGQPGIAQTPAGQSTAGQSAPGQSSAGQSSAVSQPAASGTSQPTSPSGPDSSQPAAPPSGQTTQTAPQAGTPTQTPAQGQSTQTAPQAGTSTQTPAQGQTAQRADSSGSLFSSIPLPLIIGLGILALLILGLIIFFAVRNLDNSPNRVMAQAASPAADKELMGSYAETQAKQARPPLQAPPPKSKPLPKDKIYADLPIDGPLLLNLFVADQNTAIGRRNIHSVKSQSMFTIGGGKSDFLIFLVPMPPHIADLHFDGRNCTLIPRRPEFFPDIGSQSVQNCIGKSIRVVSPKKYELFIRVERYEDPLKTLNKLLHSISVPGL